MITQLQPFIYIRNMANKTKFKKDVIQDIMEELAIGQSIRSCLSPQNKKLDRPCWATFRHWMNNVPKFPTLRLDYEKAKQDGIEYLLRDATETINNALLESKTKDKTDLGQTHLIKAYIDLAKWKSERLAPKYYAKKDSLALIGDDKSPLVVKWDK